MTTYTLPKYVLSRVRYHNGQLLTSDDFFADQHYHMDGRWRHDRLLHSAGIAEGLEVSIVQVLGVFKLKVSAGTAVDGAGRQILLEADRLIDIKSEWTTPHWVVIRYQEKDDVRPDAPDSGIDFPRISQAPLIEVVATLGDPLKDSYPVVLDKVNFSTAPPMVVGVRTHAGLRLPGNQPYSIHSANGSLHVTQQGASTDRLTLADNGNVGIGVEQPKARLTISMPGERQLDVDGHSKALSVMAGSLEFEKTKDLALASIGFHSGNRTALGIRAYRFADATETKDWQTTAIGLCMDVDKIPRANNDVSLWLHAKGHVVVGGRPPESISDTNQKLYVQGGMFLGGTLSMVGSLSMTGAENKTRYVFHPTGNGDFLQLTNDNVNKAWEFGQGITYRPTGRVGLNTRAPSAVLSVCLPGETQLQGAAMSNTLLVTGGILGQEQISSLALASIGFRSGHKDGNNTALGIHAYRTAMGPNWDTTALGLGMDLGDKKHVGASLWLHATGQVVVGKPDVKPQSHLHVQGAVTVEGDSTYGGKLSKLDVAEQKEATIRSADLRFGHPERGVKRVSGTAQGLALVDDTDTLVVNHASDWPKLSLRGTDQIRLETKVASISNKLGIGTSDLSADAVLDVRVPGTVPLRDRFVVSASADWGDGVKYVTIGGGGTDALFMMQNPHVSWMANEARASIRYGRSGGVSKGVWWDVGVRPESAFSFALDGKDHHLWIAKDGNVGIGTGKDAPWARLSVNGPGMNQLSGRIHSQALAVMAGTLGSTPKPAEEDLVLASFGFLSNNKSALGIRARRIQAENPSGWTSTAIGLSMDVDETPSAGGSIWLRNGRVGINRHDPEAMLHVQGDAKIEGDIMGNKRLMLGTPSGQTATRGEVVGALGFRGWGVQHGQLAFRAGRGFELVDVTSLDVNLDYTEGDTRYPYADLRAGTLHEGGQKLSDKYAALSHNHDRILSAGGRFALVMRNDGALVIQDPTTSTRTYKVVADASAAYLGFSDASLKRGVVTLEGVMEKLRQLRGVSFFWKDEERGTKRELGVIAQEVETVFPELVGVIDGKHLGVKYEKFAGVLIQALKEQDERITQLEERLRALGATT